MPMKNSEMFRPKFVSRLDNLEKGKRNLQYAPFLNTFNKWMLERHVAADIEDKEIQNLDKNLVISDVVNLIRMIQSTNPLRYQQELLKKFRQFRVIETTKNDKSKVQQNLSERSVKLAKPRQYKKKIEKNWEKYLENQNSVSKIPLKNIQTSRITELAKPLPRRAIKAETDISRLSKNQMALKAVASPRIIELSKPKLRNFNKTKSYQKNNLTSKIRIIEDKKEFNITKYSKPEKEIVKCLKFMGNNELKTIKSRKEINTDKIKPIEITDSSTKELLNETNKEHIYKFEKYKNKSEKFLKTEQNQIRKLYLNKIEMPHHIHLKESKQDLKPNIKTNSRNLKIDISNKNQTINGSKGRSSKSLKERSRDFQLKSKNNFLKRNIIYTTEKEDHL